MLPDNPICVPLDTPDKDRAIELAGLLKAHVGLVKIGMEFFYAHGRAGYEAVAGICPYIFLDLKLHDIPNTVAQGLTSLMTLEPRPLITNIHAGAGPATLRAAAKTMAGLDGPKPLLIGLTVLTSLDEPDLEKIGYDPALGTRDHARRQAELAFESGLGGVVCSPHDVAGIKQACGADFKTIVPGIRPAGTDIADQKRIATPAAARAAGADVLVIGRPITQSPDPAAAACAILADITREAGDNGKGGKDNGA